MPCNNTSTSATDFPLLIRFGTTTDIVTDEPCGSPRGLPEESTKSVLKFPCRSPVLTTEYQPLVVISCPATTCGISISFTTTFKIFCELWIGPVPRSTSMCVRLPSFLAKITGALSHPDPYTMGAGSLYFAALSTRGDKCVVLSPEVRT